MKRNNQKSTETYDEMTQASQQSTRVVSTPSLQATRPPAARSHIDHPDHPSVVNQAAVDLLLSWQTDDEQEQRDTWDYLKRVLEEDRLSDRSIFP